ncbi:MAG TPA: hypothetical protein VGD31_13975 [Sphingobacteriaceae bacterium]
MKKIVQLSFLIILAGCSRQMEYPTGHIPEELKNFQDANSVYDDYNSDLHVIGTEYILQFSTNRYSYGKQFDFVKMRGGFRWNQDNGDFAEEVENITQWSMYDSITTSANELGPYSREFEVENGYKYVMLYATDLSGNFDIKFSYELNSDHGMEIQTACASPQGVSFVNTPANELYPSFMIRGETSNFGSVPPIEKMFYCSDKSGNFDIYQIDFPSNQNILSFLASKAVFPSTPVGVLNSGFDDKCPYFANNRLIFASNRPGGFGGYDLYYSIYENGEFSAPVNFGEKINTPFDEYRPVIEAPPQFDNEFMLFSSNRPGGKGGFDLYYTGIPKVD